MVKMRNLVNGNYWLLHRNDFINRKYLMQEMYQSYMEGDSNWDKPKVKAIIVLMYVCHDSTRINEAKDRLCSQ